ncbi:mechanosensitive ion channel family protein [Psychroflexus sp. CAK57W]|uniref:mechanosensitive ion channel domain-containing protein n=1 Tax=Psychroflexus curvus TaxID=2873595 RepID=UPI001CCBA829|nr:mechanosensitive ion channel domain-containing protein [Psychroflexus curvus]MBZ9627631.1 mechanosensitive ion channel family protein [Psychroflexus curvus]MBZ9786118.1 mechanosensitive ion channel family protein [Psychroflexus curvus]
MIEDIFFTYEYQIIWTAIVVFGLLLLRFALKQSAKRTARRDELNFARTRLIYKYINVLVSFIAIFSLLLIWGVEVRELTVIFSSIFAVIGIGLFAIWSILSNITSGIIMFFYFPYKIGDKIQIHDKDFPIAAIIEDIKAFQLHLRTEKGELVTYPNNLFLQKSISLLKKDAIMERNENIDR